MPKKKVKQNGQEIDQYVHPDKKRINNPPVGLVTPETDKDAPKRKYQYDPHLDPQLVWAGKAERSSFGVDTVSLHVHERIDPLTIISHVCKPKYQQGGYQQLSLFEKPENYLPLRDAIDFYKHEQDWTNRLIAGDSLLVMNSLLEKEGMAGKVQMVYIDPPYGIKYRSNFQPFINQTALKSNDSDQDLTCEPEMLKAFRDTWELSIHSYLTYLRDRVLLSRQLLSNEGSLFIQVSEENVHRVRLVLDEIFGANNFVSMITIKKASVMFAKKLLNSACFYLLWYAKDIAKIKYRQLYIEKDYQWFADNAGSHLWAENPDTGEEKRLTPSERKDIYKFLRENPGWKLYGTWSLNAPGSEKQKGYEYNGKIYYPPKGTQWKTSYPDGLDVLKNKNRLQIEGDTLRVKIYYEDFPIMPINNLWDGIGAASDKIFVVQTANEIIQRCILMTTDPGDLVFDPTCGSGTTAYVAEQWGRRWITCDTSRVAIALAKQRLMTATFDYYQLARPEEGVGSGFKYKVVPHITLGSIVNNEPPTEEVLYDRPLIDSKKKRVTGPFTVEAVPAPVVKSLAEVEQEMGAADSSIARSGETLRQQQWRDELLKTGIRGKGGQKIEFSRLEPLPGTRWLHADGETKEDAPKRVVVSFGPEYAPLEQRQVELAVEEAQKLVPKPKLVVFAAFQFDPEAAKDIDELVWPGVALLKVQMNADLLTEDLKKKRASNQSFWLIGQPDVILRKNEAGRYVVEVLGFDYYNTRTGEVESGDTSKIAMWMLDTDYDGRSLFPDQVFFPLAGENGGWRKLAKALRAQIDEELIEKYHGTVSLPFEPGKNRRVAVKIIDDRGIESLRILEVE
ncbi:MAG: site-specific DNA-methyltransferase [Firmicutes bacterium]|nr:site-specific DNA-methyltransferase [Bacillota bacterium]